MLSDNEKTQSHNKQIDYLVATLLDYFRDPRAEPRYLHAAKIAVNQVLRANEAAPAIEKRFLFLASRLRNNLTPTAIRSFASECLAAGNSGTDRIRKPETFAMPSLEKAAKKDLINALASGHSETAAINRAAHELLKKKKQLEHATKLSAMASQHPLRNTFEALNVNGQRLAKDDVRHHLLRLKRTKNPGCSEGTLYNLLQKAQAFSLHRLHELMGDELFFLCRPLGFLDQNNATLLVEVPTSAHLYALTYRKQEILSALKRDHNFRTARNIRFKVTVGSF